MARKPEKQLRCPSCQAVLPWESFNRNGWTRCMSCRRPLRATVFPAMYRAEQKGRTGTAVMDEGEATCFYHETKRAEQACENCGRFLCSLCDVDFGGRHLCPRCIEAAQHKRDDIGPLPLTVRRTLYDDMALLLAIVPPLLFWFPSFVTAPATIVISIWYWRRPSSLIPRTRIRFVAAILLASAQVVGWYVLIRFAMLT